MDGPAEPRCLLHKGGLEGGAELSLPGRAGPIALRPPAVNKGPEQSSNSQRFTLSNVSHIATLGNLW